MQTTRLYQICGVFSVVGAFVFSVHIVLRSVLTAGVDPVVSAQGPFWITVNALGALGALMVLIGLAAVYAGRVARAGWVGLIGTILLGMSWIFFGVFLSLYAILILPWLATDASDLVAATAPQPTLFVVAFVLGLGAWLAGAGLLAVPFLRRRLSPRWIGYLLPFSALWMLVGTFVIAPGGPASNLVVNLLSNLGPILLVVAIGYLGFRLASEPSVSRITHG